jgi:hypothetical protein
VLNLASLLATRPEKKGTPPINCANVAAIATKPLPTGSVTIAKTMGMVRVYGLDRRSNFSELSIERARL